MSKKVNFSTNSITKTLSSLPESLPRWLAVAMSSGGLSNLVSCTKHFGAPLCSCAKTKKTISFRHAVLSTNAFKICI